MIKTICTVTIKTTRYYEKAANYFTDSFNDFFWATEE